MIITGSVLFVRPGDDGKALLALEKFPAVTFHVRSESGTELVVNLEAEDHGELEDLCKQLQEQIPEILEIGHLYVNFEEEIEKMRQHNPSLPSSDQ